MNFKLLKAFRLFSVISFSFAFLLDFHGSFSLLFRIFFFGCSPKQTSSLSPFNPYSNFVYQQPRARAQMTMNIMHVNILVTVISASRSSVSICKGRMAQAFSNIRPLHRTSAYETSNHFYPLAMLFLESRALF